MNIYVVTLATEVDRDVEAAYFVNEDGFTTFKDADHKQVATFANEHIVCIVRAQSKSRSVGTMHVTIVPTLDTAALEKSIARAQAELDFHLRH